MRAVFCSTLVQRYLTILTAISRELRLELNIIETTAWNLRYPAFFPEPPKTLQSASETVWYFYLAEIALRRLGNRILMYIYRNSFTEPSLQDEIAAVVEFEQQADSW